MPRKKNHGFAWIVTGLVFLAGVGTWRFAARRAAPPPPPPSPAAAPDHGVDWFFVLRMPAITAQYESGVETMKERYGIWLDALSHEGFHPMLLSEVRDRLSHGQGLPQKTVVTVFDPAYRRTNDILAPILKRHEWPAVWLSNGPGMERAQREFITYHTAREMIDSQWWDVGYSKPDGSFEVNSRGHAPFMLGNSKTGPWSPIDGTFAVNHGARMEALNVLSINADWGPNDLLGRLSVELPATGPTYLTKGVIVHRDWGVALSADSIDESKARFDLVSPVGRRGTRLYWLSTKAEPDFRLHVDVASVIGEFQIHLREDDSLGQELLIICTESKVIIQELPLKTKEPLFVGRHPVGQGHRFTADILLSGRHLEVSYNGGAKWSTDALVNPITEDGIVQVSILDKVRGIGRADSVGFLFTPLPAKVAVQ